ncbi:amidase domain-containing protein [Bacillus aquiflavi]|uniref:Amidase domain-containing protein n=1 Tax=Bacillus aquiflavi TaxID=2672567 RepID=A0A6B3VX06_9BACI|nr:amidase domain-containing protein [Bacillus aquiflavi]MBA4535568.1 amidase domain-containing protein [Bacillus aquiflavi]NEY79944.1 amidase domain-containing protein [Bacillus aquiflavi]
MRSQLQQRLEERVHQCVSQKIDRGKRCPKVTRKKESLLKRSAEIIKAKATGTINELKENEDLIDVLYEVHLQYLIKQKNFIYLEEEIEQRKSQFFKGTLVEDEEIVPLKDTSIEQPLIRYEDENNRFSYQYNRLKAVQYAERWWNDYNSAYKKFDVDCTNYISQCLHAGGGPMWGQPNRSRGWWMRNNNWSYSWAVAHSLRSYLGSSNKGLRAKEVSSPEELLLGDVICYDFQGDGRFDHNTIVTGKDANNMPLVNAHTTNSRMRYWAYEDSTAYTENIKYKFFTIIDDS